MEPFEIVFSEQNRAWAVRADETGTPADIVTALNLPHPTNVFVLSSGAGEMSAAAQQQLQLLFAALATFLAQRGITVLDGGTAAGGMALLGRSLAKTIHPSPYVGVLPAYAPVDDDRSGEEILEPHHTHFVLLEQDEWGSEVPLMSALANFLAHGAASLTLLVNGGGIALKDVAQSVAAFRPVMVVAGSGRLADEIALAARYPALPARDTIRRIVQSGMVSLFDLAHPPAELLSMVASIFSGRERRRL